MKILRFVLLILIVLLICVIASGIDIDKALRNTGMVMIEYTALATDTRDGTSFTFDGMITGSAFCVRTKKINDKLYESVFITNYHVVDDYVGRDIDKKKIDKYLIHVSSDNYTTASRYETEFTSFSTPTIYSGVDFQNGLDESASHTAVVMKTNKIADVAALKVQLPFYIEPLAFAKDVEIGETIYCYSAAESIPFYLTKGIVGQKGLDLASTWINLLRFNADISNGSSGSALLNEKTEVIGMTRGSIIDGYLGTMIPGQYLGVDGEDIIAWLIVEGILGGSK